jgi:hypothetical protein
MTASPWAPAPSNGGGAVAPHGTPPTAPAGSHGSPGAAPPPYLPMPPSLPGRRARSWPIIAAFGVLVVVAVAVTAVITAAIVTNSRPPAAATPAEPQVTPAAPQYSAAEQDSAKQNVCHAFDGGERGSQGGVVEEGKLNVPLVLRMVNSHAAVALALTPATPTDVADAARKYLSASTDLTTAALANESVDQLNDLTKTSNSAINSLADACGLPH